MDVSREIGRIDGRCDSLGAEIGGMRGQISDIHATTGALDSRTERIEQKLDRVIGTGPQPALRHRDPDTEPIEKRPSGNAVIRALNSKAGPHVVYGAVIVLLAMLVLMGWSGKSAEELARGKISPSTTSKPALHAESELP